MHRGKVVVVEGAGDEVMCHHHHCGGREERAGKLQHAEMMIAWVYSSELKVCSSSSYAERNFKMEKYLIKGDEMRRCLVLGTCVR